MSAADAIAKPDRKAVYFAARADLTLVRSPQQKLYDQFGRVRGATEPDRIRFNDGMFTTGDPATIEFLEEHRIYGDPFDGFVKQNLPTPAPSEAELLAITGSMTDRDALLEILHAENAGFKRPVVLQMVTSAIEALDSAQAPRQAAQKGEKAGAR